MKILAVDDDPVFLEILGQALRSSGYDDITTALSPYDALQELQHQTETFDCILLDIQMPGMNGVDLCATIRTFALYRRTPIMMITSMSAKSYIDDAFVAGATDYITKPLDPIELKARMGMVERLVHERLRSTILEHQIGLSAGAVEMQFDFETPVMIPGFDRAIEFMALKNYLLTLGIKGMFSVSSFAIHIENAGVIFRKATPLSYMNMLSDVASIISDVLKTEQVMVSYAGNGDFVAVVQDVPGIPPEEMEIMINIGIGDFESIYLADRVPMPQVKVGPLVRNSFFSPTRPARILDRAITLAHEVTERKPRQGLVAA